MKIVLIEVEIIFRDLLELFDLFLDEFLLLVRVAGFSELDPVLLAPRLEDSSLSLNFLLGVVPSATSVGGGDGDLDTGDDGASKKTLDGKLTEENTGNDGNADDEKTRGDHVLEGRLSGDLDALGVVGRSNLIDCFLSILLEFIYVIFTIGFYELIELFLLQFF